MTTTYSPVRSGQSTRVRNLAVWIIAAALPLVLNGCILPMTDKDLLGFTPDSKTLLYSTDDRIFFGIAIGMHPLGCGAQSIYLDWCDADAPRRVRRLRLFGGMFTYPPGPRRISPDCPEFSPNGRYVVIQWEAQSLLVDLKKGTKSRVAPHLPWAGSPAWLSNDELIFKTFFSPPGEPQEASRLCLYRWNIGQPAEQTELVHEERGPCLRWHLSPDRSLVLIGPCCQWGRCKLLDLKSGRARPFGPRDIRLDDCVWTSDGSLAFCELKHRPKDAEADRDTGARQYLLIRPAADEPTIVAGHVEEAPAEGHCYLGFTPDDRHLVTSQCLLIEPRTWQVTDLEPRIRRLHPGKREWSPEFRRSGVPGWFLMYGPDDKTYLIDCHARRSVGVADWHCLVSPDGGRLAELHWKGLGCSLRMGRVALPPGTRGGERERPRPGDAGPGPEGPTGEPTGARHGRRPD